MEIRELLLTIVIGILFVVIMRLEMRVRDLEKEVSQRRAAHEREQRLVAASTRENPPTNPTRARTSSPSPARLST
jgi:predicted Holliday junction resolvase-like endonuclease